MTHTKHKEIMDIRMKSVLYGTQDLQRIAKIDRLIQTRLLQQLEELEGWVEKQKEKVYDNWATTHDRDEERFTKLTKEEKAYNQALDDTLSHIREQKEVATAYKNPTISTEIG